jgi:hypothetical protein
MFRFENVAYILKDGKIWKRIKKERKKVWWEVGKKDKYINRQKYIRRKERQAERMEGGDVFFFLFLASCVKFISIDTRNVRGVKP